MFGVRLYSYDDYEDSFDPFTGAPTRSGYASFNDVSAAALRRQEEAKEIFLKHLETVDVSAGPVTTELIKPSLHLVSTCWKNFHKFVIQCGCKATRRKATNEEKTLHRETRRGTVYFINVTVTPEAKQNYLSKKTTLAGPSTTSTSTTTAGSDSTTAGSDNTGASTENTISSSSSSSTTTTTATTATTSSATPIDPTAIAAAAIAAVNAAAADSSKAKPKATKRKVQTTAAAATTSTPTATATATAPTPTAPPAATSSSAAKKAKVEPKSAPAASHAAVELRALPYNSVNVHQRVADGYINLTQLLKSLQVDDTRNAEICTRMISQARTNRYRFDDWSSLTAQPLLQGVWFQPTTITQLFESLNLLKPEEDTTCKTYLSPLFSYVPVAPA